MKYIKMPGKKILLQILSLLLLATATYFALSQRAFLATLPLFALLCIAAFLLHKPGIPEGAVIAVSAVLYAIVGENPPLYALLFAAGCLGAAFLLALAVKEWKRKEKKALHRSLALILLLICLAGQAAYAGFPWNNLEMKREGEAYLARTYPNQSFVSTECRYDCLSGKYRLLCSYLYEGNELNSELELGEQISDGFFSDLIRAGGAAQRAEAISILRDAGMQAFDLEGAGIDEDFLLDGTVLISYGEALPDTILSRMNYTLRLGGTYRQKRIFAQDCAACLSALRDSGFKFSTIAISGGVDGEGLFFCTVNPESLPEEIFSLCQSLE